MRLTLLPTMFVVGGLSLTVAACGDDETARTDGGRVHIVAAFYPLQYALQRLGGDRVIVDNLTPSGTEPHDLELTPAATALLQDADAVVYLRGFAPAVDDAVDAVASDHAVEVGADAGLDLTYRPIDEGEQSSTDSVDPHFWLDPTRLAAVAARLVDQLSDIDPDGAAIYAANAVTLAADLAGLDSEFASGLATCSSRVIVTSHNAFGYLAARYDMTQVGITGLSPENEPSPGDLAAVTDFVRDNDVSVIYYETLVSPAIAETVAAETGATTAVLDPLEGLSEASEGADYLAIMRANLASLRQGQGCSG